ncbi:MAG: hypothetical protein AB9917_13605 [Negativicutes bacterium]
MTVKRINRVAPQSGRVLLSGEQIGEDLPLVFANSAVANTQSVATVQSPSEGMTTNDPLQAYKIAVHNPSTVTDLTVKLLTVEADLADCLLDTLAIPKAQAVTGTTISAHEFLTGGIFCGGNLKLVVSNDTVLGGADGFTAKIRIREV